MNGSKKQANVAISQEHFRGRWLRKCSMALGIASVVLAVIVFALDWCFRTGLPIAAPVPPNLVNYGQWSMLLFVPVGILSHAEIMALTVVSPIIFFVGLATSALGLLCEGCQLVVVRRRKPCALGGIAMAASREARCRCGECGHQHIGVGSVAAWSTVIIIIACNIPMFLWANRLGAGGWSCIMLGIQLGIGLAVCASAAWGLSWSRRPFQESHPDHPFQWHRVTRILPSRLLAVGGAASGVAMISLALIILGNSTPRWQIGQLYMFVRATSVPAPTGYASFLASGKGAITLQPMLSVQLLIFGGAACVGISILAEIYRLASSSRIWDRGHHHEFVGCSDPMSQDHLGDHCGMQPFVIVCAFWLFIAIATAANVTNLFKVRFYWGSASQFLNCSIIFAQIFLALVLVGSCCLGLPMRARMGDSHK